MRGAMFGSVAGRERRSVWAILSLLFILGFAASTTMMHSERSGALDSVVEQARDEAQLVTASFTGKQLTEPVKGSSYDKLAAKVWKSVSTTGSIVGVTVWSSHGQILFSLNESLVGTTPPQMQSLITGISQGSRDSQGSQERMRILDHTVQTFMPESKASSSRVAIVEVDQPFAIVEAKIGDIWSTLRLGSAFGLAVSFLLLGLTFVSSSTRARAPEDDERLELDEPQELEPLELDEPQELEPLGLDEPQELEPLEADEPQEVDEAAEMKAEPLADNAPTEEFGPWFEEDVLGLQPALDDVVDQDTPSEGDVQSQELMRQRREEFKARAEKAELRVKKLEAELQEAASGPKSEQ